MKVVVAGSRSITDCEIVAECIDKFFEPIDTVVTGGARGVDTCAEKWADDNDVPVETHPIPDWAWEEVGRKSGPLRNRYMAKQGDALLAIWDGESSGTKNIIGEATTRGLYVERFMVRNERISSRSVVSEGSQSMLDEFEDVAETEA